MLGTEDSAEYVRRAGGDVVAAADGFDALVVGDQSGFAFVSGVDAALSAAVSDVRRGGRAETGSAESGPGVSER